ncbi:hypothetical protein Tco_0868728 [Tanacetum coccineum]
MGRKLGRKWAELMGQKMSLGRASTWAGLKLTDTLSGRLEYVIYRRVLRYYSGEEDGLDMRKALSRDVEKKSIIPLKRPVTPDELEYD